jgi:hypothetical protein
MMAGMQQQPQQRMGSMPPQQPAYKGTLAPGTRVAVGNITVTVKKYLSEGKLLATMILGWLMNTPASHLFLRRLCACLSR